MKVFPGPGTIGFFSQLKKISTPPPDGDLILDYSKSHSCALELFALNDSLQHVEIRGLSTGFRFGRRGGIDSAVMKIDQEEWAVWYP